MKPFSTFKFFKENKRKGLLTFIVLILSVCAVSLITVLINSIYETCNDTIMRPFTNFSLVSKATGQFFISPSITKKLKNNGNIERLITCDIDETSINLAIGGNTDVPGIFAGKKDVAFYIKKVGDYVMKGRLPNNKTDEIAVHWRVMNNKKWKIGQIVGSDKNSDEWLSGSYKIVGVLNGPNIAMVGTQTYRERQYIKNGLDIKKPICYAVFPKAGKLAAVNNMLGKLNKNDASVTTYNQLKKELDKNLGSINATLFAIILIVTIILSISVGALMYLIYLQRSDEFGILTAMGYRKGFIYRLISKEVLSLNIISWLAGLVFTYVVVRLLNQFVYIPQGNTVNFFTPTVFKYTLTIPIMVTIFSIFPILIKMRRQDPITIIERRD